MKWTEVDIETAISLIKSGLRIEEIANNMNRDFRSVQIKLQKLGFKQNKLIRCETIVCLECGKHFIGRVRDDRKFCSQSCGAKFNNRKYPKRTNVNKLKHCLNCDGSLNSHQNKFCSHSCGIDYKRKEIIKRIENGDTTLYYNQYKIYLINKFGNKCMKCGWNEVNPVTGLVPIQLEHKDGNSENHELINLELLCPNCHSLTSTFGALNKGNGRTKRRDRRNEKKVR